MLEAHRGHCCALRSGERKPIMTKAGLDFTTVAIRSVQIMPEGTAAEFEAVVHPDAHNRESVREPAAARGRGPAALHASALWLRQAFTDLAFEIHDAVSERDVVVLHTTMSGRHTGMFVAYTDDARPLQAFPPTGKHFAVTQTHWCRIADGKLVEHWANRDDLGMSVQLGWAPPSPAYAIRMQLATARCRRQDRRATDDTRRVQK